MRKFMLAVASAAAMAALAGVAQAAVSFKGRTVRVVVPSGSGGTYHLYCQILSRHLGRHIPGNPTVITENRPGAGGVKAARFMVSAAAKDGSYIAMINPGSIAMPGLRPGVGFDTLKMQWLGSMSGRAYVVGVWYKSPPKTLEDAKKMEVLMGTTGKAATSYLIPTFMNKVLGTKFKIITGYKGSQGVDLALERGEVQGRATSYASTQTRKPQWVKDKKIIRLVQIGAKPIPALTAQGVPRFIDLAKTAKQKTMVEFLHTSMKLGRSVNAPPSAPMARVEALRKAFDETMKDAAFRQALAKSKMPFEPTTGEDLQSFLKKIMATPPDVVAEIRRVLEPPKRKKK